MARYFFHTFNVTDVFDDQGTDLRNVAEVRLHMLVMARQWIEKPEHQDKHWCGSA